MEPFRPCVDARVAQWIHKHPCEDHSWDVTRDYKEWITGFPLERVDYLNLTLDVRGVIEGVIRSFRKALISGQTGDYKPWTRTTTKWVG